MAIIVGQYESGPLNRCPRPECRSTNVTRKEAGGIIWYFSYTLLTVNRSLVIIIHSRVCQAWFDFSRSSLPRPLRPHSHQNAGNPTPSLRGTKRKIHKMSDAEQLDTQKVHALLRTERKRYKNVRFHFTKMADTPNLPNVRALAGKMRLGNRLGEQGHLIIRCIDGAAKALAQAPLTILT